jgi:hypothetical protein
VSLPRHPGSPPYPGPPGDPRSQPGLIPLRPLTIGEVLATGWVILLRHIVPLVGTSVLLGAASAAVTLGTLAAAGSLQTYADAGWLEDLLGGGTTLPTGIVVATLLGLFVTTSSGPVIAGVAVAYAGAQALGRDGKGAVRERLHGRWPVLIGIALLVGVLVAAGLMVLIVPGVVAYLVLVFAAPAAVMERGSVSAALRRSSVLTRGYRGRILSAVALTLIVGTLAGAAASAVTGGLVGQASSTTTLIVSQLVSVLVGGFAGAWTGAVVAVLYIDVRIRTEHLDQALRAAAAADQGRINPQGGAAG